MISNGQKKYPAAAKRLKRFELRLTEEEYRRLVELERRTGISRAEIIRGRLLKGGVEAAFNASELLKQLDKIGVEMGRSASDISQLARHANALAGSSLLTENDMVEFNPLFATYIKRQSELEKLLRQLLRLMSK